MENVNMNETINTIFERKSVRHLIPKEINKSEFDLLLRAAMAAPTANNSQPWEFIAIFDREMLDFLADGLIYGKMLKQSSAAIVVCGDLNNEKGRNHWIEDCAAATQNILLAAESMKIGAVWTAVYPDSVRIETVRKATGIPENIIPLSVIPLGYPTGEDKPKDKFKPNRIHWERW